MKVYLAADRSRTDPNENLWVKVARRRLFSYFYDGFQTNTPSKELLNGKEHCDDLFLDSGAFTAFTKKVTIPLERYAAFVRETRSMWTVCSSLDAIGDAAQSYAYFHELRALGADVCPVFHAREDDSWLVKYLDEGHPYIFLGGMVPETTPWLLKWLDHLWDAYLTNSDGTPRVKVHGFGLTNQRLITRYPWYSVDSSSWLMTGVYGICAFPHGSGLIKVDFSTQSNSRRKFSAPHYTVLPKEMRDVVDSWLARLGVTAEQCTNHYWFRDYVNAAAYQNLEQFGTERFKKATLELF